MFCHSDRIGQDYAWERSESYYFDGSEIAIVESRSTGIPVESIIYGGKAMKKNFVRLAAFLAAAGIITGCSAGTSTGGAAAAGGGEKPRTEAAAGGGAFAGETQSVIDFSEEPYEVSIHFIGLFEENKDVDKVEAALNEITVPQINAKIDIVPLFIGNLVTTTSLGVAGDEKLDIVAVGLTSPMDSMVSDDLLLPLDELLQERGQDALRVTADVAKAQMINGKTYALSGYPYPAKAGGFVYNKTMADEFGIDMHDEMTMEEYTEVAKILKEKGIYFTTFGSSSNVNYKFYNGGDYFGTTGSFGGILKPAEETTVINVFDSQEMRDYFKTIKSWFDSGYTPSDQLTDTTRVQEYFAQQKIFGSSTMYTPGQITVG